MIIKLQLSRCDTDALIWFHVDDRMPLVMLLLLPLSMLLSPCYHANEVIKFWKGNYLIFLIWIGAWNILEVRGYGFDRSLQWWQNTISMILLLTLSRQLSPCYHASKVTIFCKGKLFNVLELGVFRRLWFWWESTMMTEYH